MDFTFLLDETPDHPKANPVHHADALDEQIEHLKLPSKDNVAPTIEIIDSLLTPPLATRNQEPIFQAMSLDRSIEHLKNKISAVPGCGPWAELKISNLLECNQELAALERQVTALNGDARKDFVQQNRSRRRELMDEISTNLAVELLQCEFDKNLALKNNLLDELKELELRRADQERHQVEDANRAQSRMARYVSQGLM